MTAATLLSISDAGRDYHARVAAFIVLHVRFGQEAYV
jgi:hypothetical protein